MTTMTARWTATVTVSESDEIQHKQDCEYAAWYTLWRVLPGKYTLERTIGTRWPEKDRPVYVAVADAEIIEDYYAAHYGGVAVSKYDIHKNAGKRGQVALRFTPMDLLKHSGVELREELYEDVLREAMAWLSDDADCQFRCIRESMGEDLGGRRREIQWAEGHARNLANALKLYEEFRCSMARRDVNRQRPGTNQDVWAKRDQRNWKTETHYG